MGALGRGQECSCGEGPRELYLDGRYGEGEQPELTKSGGVCGREGRFWESTQDKYPIGKDLEQAPNRLGTFPHKEVYLVFSADQDDGEKNKRNRKE